jgi:outer membrane protein TolC
LLPTVGVGVGALELEGAVAAPGGGYQLGHFSRISPMAMASWILNPGQAIFDIVMARRQLDAAKHDALNTTAIIDRNVALSFYDLALAQTRVRTATRRIEAATERARLARARRWQALAFRWIPKGARPSWIPRAGEIAALNAYYAVSVRLARLTSIRP